MLLKIKLLKLSDSLNTFNQVGGCTNGDGLRKVAFSPGKSFLVSRINSSFISINNLSENFMLILNSNLCEFY